MSLTYSPELIDYRLQSYTNELGKHLVRGHLLGTKVGDREWSVSDETIDERIKLFKGQDWIVSPRQFDPTEHYLLGKSYEDQIKRQKDVKRGKIVDVLGPFSYKDGSKDKYYDFVAEVEDQQVSDALVKGRLPFATSPYIWPTDDNNNPLPLDDILRLQPEQRKNVKNWIPVHSALVTRGTFGDIAKLDKMCMGPQGVCKQALAGSSKEISQILSSQIHSERQNQSNTMDNQLTNPNVESPKTEEVTKVVQPEIINNAPIKVDNPKEQKEETQADVNARIEALEKALETEKKTNGKLLKIQRTSELESIFNNIESADEKKAIFKKWSESENFDELVEFWNAAQKYHVKAKKENVLAGKSNTETVFPLKDENQLAGNSNVHKSRVPDRSVTDMFGGRII